MKELVEIFPQQIREAVGIAKQSTLKLKSDIPIKNVVICGMGGSGIGGRMVTQLYENTIQLPLVLVQNYSLPAFVDEHSLVIGCSYSGNTEETLSAVKAAKRRNAMIIGICSGGLLMQFCQENNFDCIQLPGGNPPRSMLAFSMIQIISILEKLKLVDNEVYERLLAGAEFVESWVEEIKTKANELAKLFYTKQGIIYCGDKLEAVAIRAKQQFNENSKQLVWHNAIPEMNHNELVGWGGGNDNYAVFFMTSQFIGSRNLLRIKLSEEIIGKKTANILTFEGKGRNAIEEYFYFIHLVDWSSVYLADLNQQDAVEVKVIDFLKGELDKSLENAQ